MPQLMPMFWLFSGLMMMILFLFGLLLFSMINVSSVKMEDSDLIYIKKWFW